MRTVPRHRRAALSGSRAAAGRRARPRRDHDRRVGLGSRNLVSRRRASERAALSGHGDLRHGNVDETDVSDAAPHRRQPLRRPARDEPVQRVARGHVAPRRVVGLLQRPDGRAGAQPPAVPRRGDELLRGQRSSRTDDHALMGRHDRPGRRSAEPVCPAAGRGRHAGRAIAENRYADGLPGRRPRTDSRRPA